MWYLDFELYFKLYNIIILYNYNNIMMYLMKYDSQLILLLFIFSMST